MSHTSPPASIQRMRRLHRRIAQFCLYCCAMLLFVLPVTTAHATTSGARLDISDNTLVYLQPWLEYFDPGAQTFTVPMLQEVPELQWRPVSDMTFATTLGGKRTLWYRLRLHAGNDDEKSHRNWFIRCDNPVLASMQVFIRTDDSWTDDSWTDDSRTDSMADGDADSAGAISDSAGATSDKADAAGTAATASPNPVITAVSHGSHASSFPLPAYRNATLYISATGFHSPSAAFTLQASDIFHREQFRQQLLLGMIDGLILGLVIYNALLYYKTRQRLYVIYIGLGLANLLTIVTHQNVLEFLLPGIDTHWTLKLAVALPLVVSGMLSLFIREYFDAPHTSKLCDLLILIYLWLLLVLMMAVLINTPLVILYPPFAVMSAISLFAMLYLCCRAWHQQDHTAPLVIISLFMPVVSGTLTSLVATGTVHVAHHYTTLMQCADVVEMLLLSLALAARVSRQSAQHDARIRQVAEEKIINGAHNRLLAHINHEIRTPLNGILGAAELLQGNADNQDRNILAMIFNTGKSLQHLIDGMIDIRAISENRKMLHHEPFDLNQLLRECLDLFLPLARQKNIRMYFCVDPQLPVSVTGDPYRLRQILLNLLGNAFKFTESGAIGIQVIATGTPSLYRFEVSDSGIGIAPADAGRLFDSFERGNNIDHDSQAGTGLGLSIVRELSLLMGGDAGYRDNSSHASGHATITHSANGRDSEPGSDSPPRGAHPGCHPEPVGSTFWFSARLPAAPAQADQQPYAALQQRKLLVIDSNCRIAGAICTALQATTADIQCVCDSDTASTLLTQPDIDAVIMHLSVYRTLSGHAALQGDLPVYIYRDQDETLLSAVASHHHLLLRPPSTIDFLHTLAAHFRNIGSGSQQAREEHVSVGMHVLVAEDNPTSQLVIRGILQSLGISCDICSNGQEAEQRFSQQALFSTPYNAVLMDCEMPIQDGFITTIAIRHFEQAKRMRPTPIIAITAHTEPEYRYRSHQCGMSAFVTKPINIDIIRRVLFDQLDHGRQPA